MTSVYPYLDKELKARGISYTQLADKLQLSRSTLYQRLNGEADWKLTEVASICQYLEYFDVWTLFLQLHNK